MSENTTQGPAGGNKPALPVKPHETFKPDRLGQGGGTSKGKPQK